MDCCQPDPIDNHFDRKRALKKLETYRRRGPERTTQILVSALTEQSVNEMTLLDIGGGIGAVQHELIKRGIHSATNLEASQAYMETCRMEAERLGHADRITHLHGDFAHIDDAPAADVVTLERVICCYPDMPGLVHASCVRTRRLLGIVIPHDTWLVKFAMEGLYNLRYKIVGDPFRVFAHSTQAMEDIISTYDLKRRFYRLVGSWQVIVYGRNDASLSV